MKVFSYLELHTTLIAWQLFEVGYRTIADTGIILLPLLWSIGSITLKSIGEDRGGGHDAPVGNLKSILQMVVVVFFCLIPFYPVEPTEIRFQPQQRGNTPPAEVNASTDPSTYQGTIPSGSAAVQVPTWWALLHNISAGLANTLIESLPTYTDLREAKMQLDAINISDPGLAQSYRDFLGYCYHPAKRVYNRMSRNHQIRNPPQNKDVNWAGSPFLLEMPGGYQICDDAAINCQGSPGFLPEAYAESVGPQMNPPRTRNRDGVWDLNCADWWEVIRTGVLAQTRSKQTVWDELFFAFGGTVQLLSVREREDKMVRKTLENHEVRQISAKHSQSKLGDGGITGTLMQFVSDAGSVIGAGWQWFSLEFTLNVFKQALPILMAIILMFLIAIMPLALLFSGYKIEAVIKLSFLMFTAIFLHALLAVADWLDYYLTISLFEGQDSMSWIGSDSNFFGNAQKRMLINIVLMINYIALPVLWFWTMGAVGNRAAQSGANMFDAGGGASSVAQQIGTTGVAAAKATASKGASTVQKYRN